MSSKFRTHEKSAGESYSASLAYGDMSHVFVSHNTNTEKTRMNVIGSLFSATVYLTDEEAYLLAQMLTDAVKSRKQIERQEYINNLPDPLK